MINTKLQVVTLLSWYSCLHLFTLGSFLGTATARNPGSGSFFGRSAFAAARGLSPKMNEEHIINMEHGVIVTADKLLETIDFNASKEALWIFCLRQRLTSSVASEGMWIANHETDITSVSHIEVTRKGRGKKVWMFCQDPKDEGAIDAAVMIANAAVQHTFDDSSATADTDKPYQIAIVTFAALDRRIFGKIQTSFRDQYKIKSFWEYPCGMWMGPSDPTLQTETLTEKTKLPENAILRLLRRDDADLIDSRWEYRSDGSLAMIMKMIAASESIFGGCYGLEIDGVLVAWVCRYLDGTLGMLWTEANHRRMGYGAYVVSAAMQSIDERRNEELSNTSSSRSIPPFVAFTVDTNDASRGLLAKLGWQRQADTDWVGFTLIRPHES